VPLAVSDGMGSNGVLLMQQQFAGQPVNAVMVVLSCAKNGSSELCQGFVHIHC
jgi:hypothetical protein